MVAYCARILILVLFPSILLGQSLDLSVLSPTKNNSPSTFLLESGEVSIRSNGIRFLSTGNTLTGYEALGVAPDHSIVSVLNQQGDAGQIVVLNSKGDTLNAFSTGRLSRRDPSLAVYPFNNGSVLFQDNIANFTLYNTLGDIAFSLSSSSQTKGGEAISKVAGSPCGKTLVVYNPKIKRGNRLGSKAQVKMTGGEFKNIFQSLERYIKDLSVSDDGNIVTVITAKEGTDDRVIIMDKYGNRLNTISTDEDLIGTSLSGDNEYISLYAGGRVMVHSMLDGERVGATSFRSPVFIADYFPEDNLILALTGSYSEDSGVLNNVEFRAVDLKQREITSEEFTSSLGFSKAISPKFIRLSSGEYRLVGGSKRVRIRSRF